MSSCHKDIKGLEPQHTTGTINKQTKKSSTTTLENSLAVSLKVKHS